MFVCWYKFSASDIKYTRWRCYLQTQEFIFVPPLLSSKNPFGCKTSCFRGYGEILSVAGWLLLEIHGGTLVHRLVRTTHYRYILEVRENAIFLLVSLINRKPTIFICSTIFNLLFLAIKFLLLFHTMPYHSIACIKLSSHDIFVLSYNILSISYISLFNPLIS